MEIKCKQPGCPFEYEHCCIECEELEHCTSSCNLKPDSCKNSEMNGETSLQVQEKTIKEKLLAAMEAYGITKFENDAIKITYFAPSTTTSIDSTKLKKEQPDIAKEYSKTSNKKSYIKIEVKAGDK